MACSRVNFNTGVLSTEFPLNRVGGPFCTVTTGVRFQTLGNFVSLVQNGCSAHPSSYPVDTGFPFFWGLQRPKRDADKSHQFIVKVKNTWLLPVLPPYIFMTCCLIRLYLLSAQCTNGSWEACLVNRATCEATSIYSSLGAQNSPLTIFPRPVLGSDDPPFTMVPRGLPSGVQRSCPRLFPRACSGPVPGSSFAFFLVLRLRMPEVLLINSETASP